MQQEVGVGYARWPEVARIVGASRSTVWRWERDGRFPPRRRLSAGITAWRRDELAEWIADPEGWSRDRGHAV